jgi:hypothetical protein
MLRSLTFAAFSAFFRTLLRPSVPVLVLLIVLSCPFYGFTPSRTTPATAAVPFEGSRPKAVEAHWRFTRCGPDWMAVTCGRARAAKLIGRRNAGGRIAIRFTAAKSAALPHTALFDRLPCSMSRRRRRQRRVSLLQRFRLTALRTVRSVFVDGLFRKRRPLDLEQTTETAWTTITLAIRQVKS